MGIKQKPSGYSADALFSRPVFGSPETEESWKKKCKSARERQKVRIAVAPECSVETVGGVSRKAGEEVTIQELGGPANRDELVKVGAIICLTSSEFKINNGTARHVVGRKALVGARRILDSGEVVEASDFDKDDEPAFTYTNTQGHHRTAEPVTYPTGEETLRKLVKRGFIRELKRRSAVQAAIREAKRE